MNECRGPNIGRRGTTDDQGRRGSGAAAGREPAQNAARGGGRTGIAFLWFVGVLRDRIGHREDRFFATVFLGSGLLFVAMLFVTAAVAGGVLAAASASSSPLGSDVLALGRDVTGLLLNVYSMRMAAVFTLTTVTIARRTEIVSRWLTSTS
jgi:hypothetical protein